MKIRIPYSRARFLLAYLLALVVFAWSVIAFAQSSLVTPPPEAVTVDNFVAILNAFRTHEFVLGGSLVIGLLIALSKSGWFGTFLATKVPPAARPVIAIVLGVLGGIVTQVQQGVPWQQAALNGLYAAALAVLGHQTFIQGMRGGKELLPETKAVKESMRPPPMPPAAG